MSSNIVVFNFQFKVRNWTDHYDYVPILKILYPLLVRNVSITSHPR